TIVPTLGATAQIIDARANTEQPPSNDRFRPHRSATTPPITRVAEEVIVYPLRIHDISASSASGNARWISGYTTYITERLIAGSIAARPARRSTAHEWAVILSSNGASLGARLTPWRRGTPRRGRRG